MFNDHILFSNNLNDAANQLRNIQLQKLEEEKYKKLSVNLEEKINILENKLNYLKEEKMRINLAAMYYTPFLNNADGGWSASEKERYWKWWDSLTPQERKTIEKQMREAEPVFHYNPQTGESVTPGDIPQIFQNPNIPDVTIPTPRFYPD